MTLTEWNAFLSYVGDFAEAIPLVPFLLLSKEKKREFALIGLYFLTGFTLKAISFFIAKAGANSLFIYHILAACEFIFLFQFFTHNLVNKNLRTTILVIVLVGNGILSGMPGALQQFNSMSWSVNTLLLLCTCIYSFYGLYQTSYNSWLEVRTMFIIMSGFLIYLSGCLFTYILGTQILSKELQGFFANGWIINSISNLAKDLVVSIGFLSSRQK